MDQGTETLTNCTISGNSVTATGSYGDGGGLSIGARGLDGFPFSAAATLTNCVVSGNSASQSGGGLCINNSRGGSSGNTTATLTNCTRQRQLRRPIRRRPGDPLWATATTPEGRRSLTAPSAATPPRAGGGLFINGGIDANGGTAS